ncbi:F-box protein PP2-B10-like [Cucurbita moschata]|uniref:F-box protein PP2-B10-like n=1 Tax=Cucurbita moschata TaxID=3662 RepID=A0A6J1EMR0_CUCMO|nr:F-box protein PP2-B10-like [Cucurbita moschata]
MEEEMRTAAADLSSLPEGVIAHILSLTTPLDVCRASTVSRIFHSAAQSDIVWSRFLPPDLDVLISRSKSDDLDFDPISSSKKNIFFSLCDSPMLLDDGDKSLALEKWTGRKCIMLGARNITIVWSDTPEYWTWEHHPDSRFAEVAVLLQVWWLEIRGRMSCRILTRRTTYGVYLVFKMNEDEYRGFNFDLAEVRAGILGTESDPKTVCLDPDLENSRLRLAPWLIDHSLEMSSELEQPKERQDGWFEIELGEFESGDGDDEVEMDLMEVKGGTRKIGLVVEGIEIRPKPTSVLCIDALID